MRSMYCTLLQNITNNVEVSLLYANTFQFDLVLAAVSSISSRYWLLILGYGSTLYGCLAATPSGFSEESLGPTGWADTPPRPQHVKVKPEIILWLSHSCSILSLEAPQDTMSDKSDLKAELERKKQRLAQIREEKKRKEEERKKKEVRKKVSTFPRLPLILSRPLVCAVCVLDCICQAVTHTWPRVCVSMRAYKHPYVCRRLVLEFLIVKCAFACFHSLFNSWWLSCDCVIQGI